MTTTVAVARRLQRGGCDPFLSVDTRLFPRSASDWRQHPFRYAAASHGCFDRPRPAGAEADNNHDTAPPLSQLPAGLFFWGFFSPLPSDLSSLLSQQQKKTPPTVKMHYGERRLFLHSRRNIEGSLFFSPPRREKTSWCGVQPA